jgi:hypothetical protein
MPTPINITFVTTRKIIVEISFSSRLTIRIALLLAMMSELSRKTKKRRERKEKKNKRKKIKRT